MCVPVSSNMLEHFVVRKIGNRDFDVVNCSQSLENEMWGIVIGIAVLLVYFFQDLGKLTMIANYCYYRIGFMNSR